MPGYYPGFVGGDPNGNHGSGGLGGITGLGHAAGQALFGTEGSGALNQLIKNGQGYSYLGGNPYQDDWNTLITQLQQRAAGVGPSLAVQQYQQASNNAMNQAASFGAGRGQGGARAASMAIGNAGQNMASGSAMARTQEMQASQAALQNALLGAGQSQYDRERANQMAYLQAVQAGAGQQSNFQKALGVAGQVGSMFGMGTGGGGGQGSARTAPSQNVTPQWWSGPPGGQNYSVDSSGPPGMSQPSQPYNPYNPYPVNPYQ